MTNEHSSEPGHDALDDETIVVAGDETIVHTRHEEDVAVVDDTYAVADEAHAVTDESHAVTDETFAVADETIVVNADSTVVVPARPTSAPVRRRDRRVAAQRGLRDPQGTDPAPPVKEGQRSQGLHLGVGAGFDADRPIAPVPGAMPWEAAFSGERGVSQGLPVSYGARLQTETRLQTGVDEVQRVVGPAPAATPVGVLAGREQLPSLQRKDLRRKRITLAIYGGVIVACAVGLWGVAAIAFGW